VEAETRLLAGLEEVRTRGDGHPNQEGNSSTLRAAPEGNQERAMVLASRSSGSPHESIAEWLWPDPSNPGEARFVLRDHREEKL
jgi:hypothetical protein